MMDPELWAPPDCALLLLAPFRWMASVVDVPFATEPTVIGPPEVGIYIHKTVNFDWEKEHKSKEN